MATEIKMPQLGETVVAVSLAGCASSQDDPVSATAMQKELTPSPASATANGTSILLRFIVVSPHPRPL